MKRVYVIVPSVLMLAFIGYFYWWAPHATTFRLLGGAPQWWGKHVVAVTPLVTAPVASNSPDEYDGRDGEREALEHLHAGKVALLGYGLPYPWDAELKVVWKREFNVESRDVAGCMVTEALVTYVSRYNRVMEAHIAERFGSDAFDVVFRKAQALYKERLPRNGEQSSAAPAQSPKK